MDERKTPRKKFSFDSLRPRQIRLSSSDLTLDAVQEQTQPPPSPSPSITRWNNLRQHVLPPTIPISVPATPKPSRLAHKLGFRQVVDQAVSAAEGFEVDVRKAAASGAGAGASLPVLYNLLSAGTQTPLSLPTETLVLGVLLYPFYNGNGTEQDKALALKTFEVLMRYPPTSEVVVTERGLWAVKVAQYSLGPLQAVVATSPPFSSEGYITVLQALFGVPDSRVEGFIDAIQLSQADRETRDALLLEGWARCVEYSSNEVRRGVVRRGVEHHWQLQVSSSSTAATIKLRVLRSFTRGVLALLSTSTNEPELRRVDGTLVIWAFQTRVFPELASVSSQEVKKDVVRVVIELFMGAEQGDSEITPWVQSTLGDWCNSTGEWKESVESVVRDIVTDEPWDAVIRLLVAITNNTNNNAAVLVGTILPSLFDVRPSLLSIPSTNTSTAPRLPTATPNANANTNLTQTLKHLSTTHPKLLFKPLFSLAASSSPGTAATHLNTLIVLDDLLAGAMFMHDAEMICVALMSSLSGKETEVKVGQVVLMVEVVERLRKFRRGQGQDKEKDRDKEKDKEREREVLKFAMTLEAKLGMLIELRWLPILISWFLASDHHEHDHEERGDDLTKVEEAYTSLRIKSKPPHSDPKDKLALLTAYPRKALKLFVSFSALISTEDWSRLVGVLWGSYLSTEGDVEPGMLSSVCFLLMQCAEKVPRDFGACVEIDVQSSDPTTRLNAIKKLTTLTNWRYQILPHPSSILSDRTHRIFKLGVGPSGRAPLLFVPTDMGSTQFILEDSGGPGMDRELKKQLAEIGWEDAQQGPGQGQGGEMAEWVKTPMSNLPLVGLGPGMDVTVTAGAPPSSPSLSPSTASASPLSSPGSSPLLPPVQLDELALLRRNSSSASAASVFSGGTKRRAVFVPSLGGMLPGIFNRMVYDDNVLVSSAAKTFIMDLMKNDPSLVLRPVWDLLGDGEGEMAIAIRTLESFIHVRHALPPAMAHAIFNHLAGYLKFLKTHAEGEAVVDKYARVLPIMTRVVNQVMGMSVREMRRAKLEVLFVPSGGLWFSEALGQGEMFPSWQGKGKGMERLVSVTLVRISQNMLFLGMLKRNPGEVGVVRKSMVRLVLPGQVTGTGGEAVPLELKDFVPRKLEKDFAESDKEKEDVEVKTKTRGLSLILSRSYLLLVAQMFRSMSRHLNDRNELAVLIDGVNRILLAHGSDIGIVSHALIALMVASTRFRRLFASGGGYILFMPGILKVYAECEAHSGIRHAIEYAISRFYAHHQETFVFQSLSAVSHLFLLPTTDGEWFAKHVYMLFSSLSQNISSRLDEAGIYDANRMQEREALIVTTVEEKPQTFFAALRVGGGKEQTETPKPSLPADFPQEYETKRLGVDNLVRLFLTVIAHDVTIARAEQFLKTLRFLAPYLYHASTAARNVLQEGIVALGVILSRATRTAKAFDPTTSQVNESMESQTIPVASGYEQHLADKIKEPSDIIAMRLDYLHLVVAFTRAGGKMTAAASRTTFELVKMVLREPSSPSEAIASVLGDYLRNSLLAPGGRSLKAVVHTLRDLAPVVSGYASSLNLSPVLETIADLCDSPTYSGDSTFSYLVVNQICGSCLSLCEQAAADKLVHVLAWRSAMIRLMAVATMLRGADIFAELRKHKPTYELMTYVVLPLALRMKTTAELELDSIRVDPTYREFQARTWIRMLSYALACCDRIQAPDQSTTGISLARSRSRDSRNSEAGAKSQLPALLLTLQVIKVLFIRAEKELTSCLPEVWMRLAGLLRSILEDGNAEFVLRTKDSPAPSPTPSPRASGQFDFTPAPDMSRPFSTGGRPHQSPRFVDYCFWSISELLCVYRTPLFLQLRAFIHEKVHTFDRERRYQEEILQLPSPRPRRPSSVFSKPRLRLSNTPSPESSPRLRPTNPFEPGDSSFRSLRPDSLGVGYHIISPPTPPTLSPRDSQTSTGPRIIHLGPVSPSQTAFRRSLSPMGGAKLAMADSTRVRSIVLIRKTYARIRVVQSRMGYPLLQVSSMASANALGDDFTTLVENDGNAQVWTKARALREVVQETQELMDEFDEAVGTGEDNGSEGVFVNGADESFASPGAGVLL
ncbi:hypothetical protein VNI00_005147 [Paramarasmius palmivorus]|uniref:Protein UNC80 C-terminal domain-containing protein n=1 Tax=Paramarasmius palmivorus TaxID=297713 RepID=A0AAW0DJB4_9AGAR